MNPKKDESTQIYIRNDWMVCDDEDDDDETDNVVF